MTKIIEETLPINFLGVLHEVTLIWTGFYTPSGVLQQQTLGFDTSFQKAMFFGFFSIYTDVFGGDTLKSTTYVIKKNGLEKL